MHRLRSKSAIHRFRYAAILLCARYVLTPVTAGVLGYSIMIHDDPLTLFAMGLALFTVILVLLQWLVSSRTNCPLCITPVLANKECNKHRLARSFLGSHRLRVALSILFKNSFRCPYCHEPTALQVRERNHR